MKTKLWMTLLKFLVMTLLICSLANAQESGPIKVGLTLSGGGVRAAAFSYGVMRGLDEINVCVNNNYKEVGIGIRYFAKPVNSSKLLTEPRDAKCKKQGFTTISVLSAINYLSAVSGGSITASYYMTHDDEEFKEEFRDLLGDLNVTWDIVKNMESRLHLGGTGFGEKLPLSIALLLTSAIDTAKNIAFAPFAWMLRSNDWEMPFINSDLTPPMFLAASRGLISVKRWQETYEDWIFDGNELTFNDILEERSNITLLIHATDIKNRRPFTFDEWTFKCLGISKMGYQNFPIALAAAASSALPVLFEPLKLNKYLDENFEEFRRVDAIPPTCPRIIQDKTERRTPELLDGGLQENLGLAGLIRTVFREKSKKLQSVQTKNFIIVVNSAAPGVEPFPHIGTDPSTMLNNIDQSIDNLQREKTDFARSTYQGPLNNFGFASLEVNFSDITKDPNLVKRIAMLINESGGGLQEKKSMKPWNIQIHLLILKEGYEKI